MKSKPWSIFEKDGETQIKLPDKEYGMVLEERWRPFYIPQCSSFSPRHIISTDMAKVMIFISMVWPQQ